MSGSDHLTVVLSLGSPTDKDISHKLLYDEIVARQILRATLHSANLSTFLYVVELHRGEVRSEVPIGVLGWWAFSLERGTPVSLGLSVFRIACLQHDLRDRDYLFPFRECIAAAGFSL